jgi:hypothetical protein
MKEPFTKLIFGFEQLYVQAKTLKLPDEHVERFGKSGCK